jgi:uncharacterized membrane protein
MRRAFRGLAVESDWRAEALRTNMWLIPAIESAAAVALFAVTLSIDEAAFHGELRLPSRVISGSPDAARQILSSLAGALITVVGVVFSVVIVALTLASQQFGPRMLRTFIRDRGSQLTLPGHGPAVVPGRLRGVRDNPDASRGACRARRGGNQG